MVFRDVADPVEAGSMLTGWSIELVGHPDAVAADWDGMEAAGCATVYQRRAFVGSWLDSFARKAIGEAVIVVLRHEAECVMILPLVVSSRAGVRIARFAGGSHANHNMPIFRPCRSAALPVAAIRSWLVETAIRARIDAFVFERQPEAWDGHSNPLVAALGGVRSPTIAQDVSLDGGFEALLQRHNGPAKRKKLKAKEKILVAAGDYEILVVDEPEPCKALLEVFFEQKSARLRAQGIRDTFGDAETQDFFRRLADRSSTRAPLLRIAALKAGGAVRAVFGFAVHKARVSLMVLSYSHDELTRASPGETLLFRLFERLGAAGITRVDFGVGRERYKDSWSDVEIPLHDSMMPVTLAGRAYVGARRSKLALERVIRGNPRLWAAFKAARRLLGGRAAPLKAPEADEGAQ